MAQFTQPPRTANDLSDANFLIKAESKETTISQNRRTMVGEWYPQSGVQLTWPHDQTDWADMLEQVTPCYIRMAYEIALREPLIIVTPQPKEVEKILSEQLPNAVLKNIHFVECPTNDTWARDHAFLSIVEGGKVELMDYKFNGWGGKFEATLDNAINRHLWENGIVRGIYIDCLDFEFEGGSIESDGKGTLLTTSQCLLNPNRNPSYSKSQIEARLCKELGALRILWLDHGALAGDDTDSHIDTLARLCPNDTIVYVKTEDQSDEHYESLMQMEKQLQSMLTLNGEPYRLLALPLPDAIFDDEGNRLPATYANYLVVNGAVLCPTYQQREKDNVALEVLQKAFIGYDIVGIDCTPLIYQHGSLHCATMQYPRGVLDFSTNK